MAGVCGVGPALPSNKAEGGFTRRAGLGRQLQMLYMRALLNLDGPALTYVRRSIQKQADRVREGGAFVHPDPARREVGPPSARDSVHPVSGPREKRGWSHPRDSCPSKFQTPPDVRLAPSLPPVTEMPPDKLPFFSLSSQRVYTLILYFKV